MAKGVKLGKNKSAQHGLWMSKIKTKLWLDELKRRAEESDAFRKTLEENLAEQRVIWYEAVVEQANRRQTAATES